MKLKYVTGFTLLEVLVVLALLSLIMMGLASSFFTLAQTESRVDQRLELLNQRRTSMHFLDQTLGRVSERRRPGVHNVQDSRYWFEGQNQQVRWVGIMPARYGAGGRYFFQLGLEPHDGHNNLVIRFSPWEDMPGFAQPSQMQARVLAVDVSHFSLQYRGESARTLAWSERWQETETMPSHIMLNLATAEDELPMKIIAMRRGGSALFMDPFSIGGARVVGK